MTAGAIAVPTIVPLRAPVPGQHKTCIDTNTKIELRSETERATIYYSTNGSKPEPFQKVGPAASSTFRYRGPFRLPGGKKSLKAVAVSEDGLRESFVVTKTFDVEQLEPDPSQLQEDELSFVNDIPANELAKKEMRKFAHKMVTSKEAWSEVHKMNDTEDMMREMSVHGSGKRHPGPGTKYLNNRLGTTASDRVTIGNENTVGGSVNGYPNGTGYNDLSHKRAPPDTATQALRLQRETDFLKCIYCFAARPSDPYSRFCNECGNPVPPLPQSRMPPPEAGQMGTCVSCKSLVPFNTLTCLVCEAPIPQQNIPQASLRLANKKICTVCGTGNPANVNSCLTCEARLPTDTKPIHFGSSAPPLPKEGGRLMTCTKCGRVNNPDARFCDWCGAKPSPPTGSLGCSKCLASNHPYARFCASCGVLLEPPQRPDARNSGLAINVSSTGSQPQWLPVSIPASPIPKYEVATQTVGLFYPSQQQIQKKDLDQEEKIALEKQIRDRKPLMTAVSPGRGYWRKQMEHVCTHLKAYAANNPEFRALIGEPKMGKLISSSVHEDGYEMSLTVNFALRGSKDPFVGKEMGVTNEFLSMYTTGRKTSMSSYASQDSLVSGPSTARTGRKRSARRTRKKKPAESQDNQLTPEDRKLLKEVGKNGDGRPEEVQQLVEEGADPNCVNKNEMPALHLATLNKHVDAIPVLVQEGADVNKRGPNGGNAALHDAVSLGSSGMETVDTLLGCGAKSQQKNDKGETAYDLAVKLGHDLLAQRFMASLGQKALGSMLKPRAADDMAY